MKRRSTNPIGHNPHRQLMPIRIIALQIRSLCLVVVFVFTAGCTSTHVVDSNNTGQWIPQAQTQLLGEDVAVRTVGGHRYSGTLTFLSPDSLKLNEGEGEIVVTEALSNVAYIGEPPDILAPILGCFGGAIVGGLIGGALAAQDEEGSDALISGTVGGVVGGTIGSAAGALIGGLTSTVDQYEVRQSGKREATVADPVR